MSETLQHWEGRVVDEKFPLRSYIGESDHSAVFVTVRQGVPDDSGKVVIKLIPADAASAKNQFLRWQSARELNHPNLIRIFESGQDGAELLYVVEEYAEENLAQILPERALTAEEVRGMLPPVLQALQYVHDNGFVHGHIQPSNILAIGDRVKLSSDAMVGRRESGPGGPPPRPYHPPEAATGAASTASDVWQLGMMLIEVLTQRAPVFDAQENKQPAVPDGIPQPFREIIENCLRVDPARRWTVTQIADRLEGRQPEAPSPARAAAPITAPITTPASLPSPEREKRSAKWPYALAAIVAVSIVVFLIARPKPSESTSDVQSTPAQPSVAAGSAQSAQTATQSEPKQSPAAPPETKAEKTVPASGDDRKSANADTASTGKSDVVKRVIPEVSAAARRTINGTVRVRVAVSVDPAGNVTSAEIEAGQTSKYFDRLALEAARNWKFSPAQAGGQSGEKERNLQFAFSRAKTEAFVVSAKR